MTAARQLRRYCWVEGELFAFPARTVAARVMRGKMRRRSWVSHVCSRSRACSRQVSAREHVEQAAIWTLRSVGMRVPRGSTRSSPARRGPASSECACAGGRCFPGPVAPVLPWSSVVPGSAPLVGIPSGKPSTPGGRGRQARHPAGPHRLIGAPNGVGTHSRRMPACRGPWAGSQTRLLLFWMKIHYLIGADSTRQKKCDWYRLRGC